MCSNSFLSFQMNAHYTGLPIAHRSITQMVLLLSKYALGAVLSTHY